jgi:uncharacterized protein (DUF2147 family)
MRNSAVPRILALIVTVAWACAAAAQTPAPAPKGEPATGAAASFDTLRGRWVRPDGGYTIAIKSIGPKGELEAMYFNPSPLPFAKAQASREGMTLRTSFELRAGGYDGSTYELTYDPAKDRLQGIYYQAVQQRKYDVYFVRQ